MLTNVITMLYNNSRARKIPRQLYFSTIYNWREVRCESMSNVIVKENETLDSALRRFKRSCAKAGIQQEIRKREHYEKPSVRRKKKSEAARKRKYNELCAKNPGRQVRQGFLRFKIDTYLTRQRKGQRGRVYGSYYAVS